MNAFPTKGQNQYRSRICSVLSWFFRAGLILHGVRKDAMASGLASALRATPLRFYRRDFSSFVKVPSPPGKGEKVADRPDEGVIRCLVCPESPNSVVLRSLSGFTRRADALPLALGLLFIALTPAARAESPRGHGHIENFSDLRSGRRTVHT
jgi:hypothetical protein